MRILITGSNGLLGQKIVNQLVKKGSDFIATSKGKNRNSNCPATNYKELDITDVNAINHFFSTYEPTAVINTAAMTNVDACEEDPVNCRIINIEAVNNLFEQCKKKQIHFVQLSTDFVFDGKNGPYVETDQRNPLSVYAKSKRDAEDLLLNSSYQKWTIIRTIIVFGRGENLSRSNIVLWAKDALLKQQPLTIVDDQFRAPTWADDLAWACIRVCEAERYGTYHISGPASFSVYELVVRIAKHLGVSHENVSPIKSETLNQKAKRPPKTGFVLDKATNHLGYKPMSFEESLRLLD